MQYDLVNCYNETVFTSVESSSKNKEYERAYHEAIKKTFEFGLLSKIPNTVAITLTDVEVSIARPAFVSRPSAVRITKATETIANPNAGNEYCIENCESVNN